MHHLLLQIKKEKESRKKERNFWFLEQNLSILEKEEIPLQRSNIKGRRAKHNWEQRLGKKINHMQGIGYGHKILTQRSVEIHSIIFQRGKITTLEV